MSYVSLDEMDDLPLEEPERAFVIYEERIRARFTDDCRMRDEHDDLLTCKRLYMSAVLPAIEEFGIKGFGFWDRPDSGEKNLHDFYERFMIAVDWRVEELKLQILRQKVSHSVALDPATKAKLRHLVEQIRMDVDRLDISAAKKDALFRCINALQVEIDRERTRWQAFGALMIEACDDVGEAAKRLEPVIRAVERVGAALGLAKRNEVTQRQLPSKPERKRLEPPKKRVAAEEDIPF